MFPLLHQFIVTHKRLVLPGIGELAFVHTPARLDAASRQLMPPAQTLVLQPAGNNENPRQLYSFLTQKLDTGEEEAYTMFQKFCRQLKLELQAGKFVTWNNLGRFERNEDGLVTFTQERFSNDFLPPVAAERLVHEGSSHAMLVGDTETTTADMQEMLATPQRRNRRYWWIWAILLGAGAAALIWLKMQEIKY